jgi:DNA-directed RNA polymerase specialized sigma24 family protein
MSEQAPPRLVDLEQLKAIIGKIQDIRREAWRKEQGPLSELYRLLEPPLRERAEGVLPASEGGLTLQASVLLSDTFLKIVERPSVLRALEKMKGVDDFFAYVQGMMRNGKKDHRRRRAARTQGMKQVGLDDGWPGRGRPLLDRLAGQEVLQRFHEALDWLRAEDEQGKVQATIVHLRAEEEMTFESIAGAFGQPHREVPRRIYQRGVRRLLQHCPALKPLLPEAEEP